MDNLKEKKWAYLFLLAVLVAIVQGVLFFLNLYLTGEINYVVGVMFVAWTIWATYCGVKYFRF